MFKKLALILLSAVLLGGCTLGSLLKTDDAAKDTKPNTLMPSPVSSSDPGLDAVPTPGSNNDISTLETDIKNTIILDEDFTDLN